MSVSLFFYIVEYEVKSIVIVIKLDFAILTCFRRHPVHKKHSWSYVRWSVCVCVFFNTITQRLGFLLDTFGIKAGN